MADRKRRKTGGDQVLAAQGNKSAIFVDDLCKKLSGIDAEYDGNTLEIFEKADNVPESLRRSLVSAANALKVSVENLQKAVDSAKKLSRDETSVASDINQVQELIAYAHRLSFTTTAPHGYIPGKTPLGLFKPPAPQDMHLRSSILHQFHREYESKKQAGQRAAAYSAVLEPQLPHAATEAAPPPPPTNLAALLDNLPPMPDGWKPGDPIPGLALPPLDLQTSLATASAKLQKTAQPAEAIVAPQQPKPSAGGNKAEDVSPAVAAPFSAAFDFSLNPDMEMEFGASDNESESSDDDDD